MSEANKTQIGGDHYKTNGEEHWDRMYRMFGSGYFIGCITKYVERHEKKNGIEDLEKAQHFLQKLIELKKKQFEHCTGALVGNPAPLEVVYSLDCFSTAELFAEIQRRNRQAEQDSMAAHAASLDGDKGTEWRNGRCVSDEEAENEWKPLPPVEDVLVATAAPKPVGEQNCAGCGAPVQAMADGGFGVLHAIDCPRLAALKAERARPRGAVETGPGTATPPAGAAPLAGL